MSKRHALKVLRALCFAVALGLGGWVLLGARALECFGLGELGLLLMAAVGYWVANALDEW